MSFSFSDDRRFPSQLVPLQMVGNWMPKGRKKDLFSFYKALFRYKSKTNVCYVGSLPFWIISLIFVSSVSCFFSFSLLLIFCLILSLLVLSIMWFVSFGCFPFSFLLKSGHSQWMVSLPLVLVATPPSLTCPLLLMDRRLSSRPYFPNRVEPF